MGSNLSEPVCDINFQSHTFSPILKVSVAGMQGWRNRMEDCHFIVQLSEKLTLVGVCDGHGGPEVAHYIAKHFPSELVNEPLFKKKKYQKALQNVCKRIDNMLLTQRGESQILQLRKELKVSKNVYKKDKQIICSEVGSTVNIILLTEESIFTVNVGDSRAVLNRNNVAVALSNDHKPNNTLQKNRVIKNGGTVVNGRINNGLNVSRAFGDFKLKNNPKKPANEQLLISIPQIKQLPRDKDDKFIIMGCDGIWQKYINNNQAMVDKISSLLQKNQDTEGVLKTLLMDLLAKSSQDFKGCDNMTAMLITFK